MMSLTFMELLRLTFGLALLVGLGRAMLELLAPTVAASASERWGLAFLLGTGGISLAGWWLSPSFSHAPVQWVTTLVILATITGALLWARPPAEVAAVVSALRRAESERRKTVRGTTFAKGFGGQTKRETQSRGPVEPRTSRDERAAIAAGVLLVALCGVVMVVSLRTPLGWDGVFNFEMKARLALSNEPSGTIPIAYFADVSRNWSHPQYPLLLPLTETWLYEWIGRPNQAALKILFPLFYFSLVALFCAALRRHFSQTWALIGCVGLALIPALTVGPGGATTGYADVPLAAFVFGAISYACGGLGHERRPQQLVLAATLSALAAWTKREGLLLAGCLVGAVLAGYLLRVLRGSTDSARWKRAAFALALGPALVAIPWWVFQRRHGIPDARDFLAVTPATIEANISRLPVVAGLVGRELLRAGRWATLWPAFAVMTLFSIASLHRSRIGLLTTMVVGPVGIYVAVFALSAWPSYQEHVGTALPRLLLPLAPTAWLATLVGLRDVLRHPGAFRW